jgi:hypothetical protein
MKKIIYLAILLIYTTGISQAQLQQIKSPIKDKIAFRNEADERRKLISKNATNEVWFYEHANYQGSKYILSKGKFCISNLRINDFFSSAIIPKQLMVKVFLDDNQNGNWILLKADEINAGYNQDFSNLQNYQCGQHQDGLALQGTLNINDLISSIEIFDPSQDYVMLYDDCNYKGNQLRLIAAPTPIANSPSMNNFKKNGWKLLWFDPEYKARKSSISLHGNIASVDLALKENGDYAKFNTIYGLDCFTKIEYVDPVRPDDLLTYNDKVRWVRINFKFGTVIVNN